MLKELNEFKDLFSQKKTIEKVILEQIQKKKIIDKKMNQFLNRTVFVRKIIVEELSKNEKIISEKIVEVLSKCKHPWAKLIIYDYSLKDICIFGMVKEIESNIERIARMVTIRQESMIGFVLISLDIKELSFKRFI